MPRKAVAVAAKVPAVARATRVKAAAPSLPAVQGFNPFAHIEDEIDNMEKKFGLTSMSISEVEDRFDSGLLCVNLQMAGGLLAGGWYTFFGGEQSCKTTLATCVLGSITRQEDFLGRSAFFDYEGSFSAEYAENMWRYAGNGRAKTVDNVFGVKDNKGNWAVKPRVRYYTPSVGEDFFNYLAKLEKALPDVVLLDGSFYYLFENTKPNQKLVSGMYDKEYFRRFNKFKVPAANGLPQAIILVDSYPAMLPGRMDEKDEGTDGLASQARMFSDGIKRVKGAMKRKRIVVLGINQLRSVPMAMYGPTEQEPCGSALKFFCLRKDMLMFTDRGIITAEDAHLNGVKSLLALKGEEDVNLFGYFGKHVTSTAILRNGMFMSGRREHRVMAIRNGASTPAWTKLEELHVGDYLPVKVGGGVWATSDAKLDFDFVKVRSQGVNVQNACEYPKVMTPRLARLLGMLTADGYLGKDRVSFVNTDKKKVYECVELLAELFGVTAKVKRQPSDVFEVVVYSRMLNDFLTYLGMYGKKSRDKVVSWAVMQSTKDCVVSFLSGLFDCDSYVCKKKSDALYFNTTSGEVAHVVQQMLLNFGVTSRLRRNYEGSVRNAAPENPSYPTECNNNTIRINADGLRILLREVPISKNKELLEKAASKVVLKPSDTIPFEAEWRADLVRVMEWLRVTLRKQTVAFSDVTQDVQDAYFEYCSTIQNTNKRNAFVESMDKLLRLKRYTEKHNLIWVRVDQLTHASEPVAVYDANMPITSTTVGNGIVSHNSDVRFRMSSISIPHGKGMMEEEDSLSGEGVDTYRYIKCKAYKNKLGGPQGSEMILRIRVSDANGTASGFCRVWDCWNYLKETGQISGQRNKIKFSEGTPFAGKTVSWMEFKALIDGDKDLIKKGCDKLAPGKKPLRLYEWCRHQIASGKGYSMYLENIKNKNTAKKSKKAAALDGEDEE